MKQCPRCLRHHSNICGIPRSQSRHVNNIKSSQLHHINSTQTSDQQVSSFKRVNMGANRDLFIEWEEQRVRNKLKEITNQMRALPNDDITVLQLDEEVVRLMTYLKNLYYQPDKVQKSTKRC